MAQNEMIWNGAFDFVTPTEAEELESQGLAQRCKGLRGNDLLPAEHFEEARKAAKKAAAPKKSATKPKTEQPPLPPGVQAPASKQEYNTRQMKAKKK